MVVSMASNNKPASEIEPDKGTQKLSAWERWQLPNMDADRPFKENAYSSLDKKTVVEQEEDEPEEVTITPLTAEDLEAIREAAYKEGFDEGFAEGKEQGTKNGYEEGLLSGESEVKANITKLSQICRALLDPIPNQDHELEQVLLQLVEQICRRVVHRELLADSTSVTTIVREAIDCLQGGSKRLRIHLNAEDTEFVLHNLKQSGELDENWSICAHPSITAGGCIVETEASLVDARAERRLAIVIDQGYQQRQQVSEEQHHPQGNIEQLMDEYSAFTSDPLDDPETDSTDELDEIDSHPDDLVDLEQDIQADESKPAS